jgi:hypothetical protein
MRLVDVLQFDIGLDRVLDRLRDPALSSRMIISNIFLAGFIDVLDFYIR